MEIKVNGEVWVLEEGKTGLRDLLAQLQIPIDQPGIAIAVNLELVPRSEWADFVLSPYDTVEIITARQGG